MRSNRLRRRKRGLLDGRKSFERQHKIGQGIELHIQRAEAQLIVSQGVGAPKTIYKAMVLLSELSPNGIMLFSEVPFGSFQNLTLNIPNLKNFFAKGQVISCKEIPVTSGIIPKSSYRYRLTLKFQFGSDEEKKAVEDYCDYLRREYLQTRAA